MDLNHKTCCCSNVLIEISIRLGLGFILLLTIAQPAVAAETFISNLKVSLSSGRLEGSDLLTGAEGVYRQFKGTPGNTASAIHEKSQSSGSSLYIKDANSELFFQRLDPRIETRLELTYVIEPSRDSLFTTSAFVARSSVRYGFERGIGVLIDPAYLSYEETRLGIGFQLARIFRPSMNWEFSLAPLTEFNYQLSRTRLSSALIDVNYRNTGFQVLYGVEVSAKPFRDIPIAAVAGIRRSLDRSTFLNAKLQYTLAF